VIAKWAFHTKPSGRIIGSSASRSKPSPSINYYKCNYKRTEKRWAKQLFQLDSLARDLNIDNYSFSIGSAKWAPVAAKCLRCDPKTNLTPMIVAESTMAGSRPRFGGRQTGGPLPIKTANNGIPLWRIGKIEPIMIKPRFL
jgi:hypothetical protein